MGTKCEIFISYTEDSPEHIDKVRQIADRLTNEGFKVDFYDNEPLGSDMVRFMRRLEKCDIALIIGTSEYKRRACAENSSGVSFEDGIFSSIYMSDDREKIVPLAFGNFESSIPVPFNKLKGMKITGPTETELDTLVAGLINRYKVNAQKNMH